MVALNVAEGESVALHVGERKWKGFWSEIPQYRPLGLASASTSFELSVIFEKVTLNTVQTFGDL